MKIVYLTDSYMTYPEVGVVPDPFRQQVLEVLKRQGHQVTMLLVNRDYLKDRSIDPIGSDGRLRLARAVAAARPDLVLSIDRAGLCPEVLELEPPRIASWFIDDVNTAPPELLHFAARELVFFAGSRDAAATDGPSARGLEGRRFHLPLGVSAESFKPRDMIPGVTNRRLALLFMGSYPAADGLWHLALGKSPAFYDRLKRVFDAIPSIRGYSQFEALLGEVGFPRITESDRRRLYRQMLAAQSGLERVRMLEAIRPLGLTLYGERWERLVPEHMDLLTAFAGCWVNEPELLASLYHISGAAVNITPLQGRLSGTINLRVFEALTAGAPLMSDAPEMLEGMLEDGVHYLSYRDGESLRARCEWALANPAEAKQLAAAGREAVLAGHTLEHRLGELMRIVDMT